MKNITKNITKIMITVVKPSFIIENEAFGGVKLEIPFRNRGKLAVKHKIGDYDMQYYQTENFTSTDTADATNLFMNISSLSYEDHL